VAGAGVRPVDEATFALAGVAEDAYVVAADVAVHQVCTELESGVRLRVDGG
jgi:hypothetical protein